MPISWNTRPARPRYQARHRKPEHQPKHAGAPGCLAGLAMLGWLPLLMGWGDGTQGPDGPGKWPSPKRGCTSALLAVAVLVAGAVVVAWLLVAAASGGWQP